MSWFKKLLKKKAFHYMQIGHDNYDPDFHPDDYENDRDRQEMLGGHILLWYYTVDGHFDTAPADKLNSHKVWYNNIEGFRGSSYNFAWGRIDTKKNIGSLSIQDLPVLERRHSISLIHVRAKMRNLVSILTGQFPDVQFYVYDDDNGAYGMKLEQYMERYM